MRACWYLPVASLIVAGALVSVFCSIGKAQVQVDMSFARSDVQFSRQADFDVVNLRGASQYAKREGFPQLPTTPVTIALPSGSEAVTVRTNQPDIPGAGYDWQDPVLDGWRRPSKFVLNWQAEFYAVNTYGILLDNTRRYKRWRRSLWKHDC